MRREAVAPSRRRAPGRPCAILACAYHADLIETWHDLRRSRSIHASKLTGTPHVVEVAIDAGGTMGGVAGVYNRTSAPWLCNSGADHLLESEPAKVVQLCA